MSGVANYRIGQAYTAWHDPALPTESFLARERVIVPYLFTGIPLLGLILCGFGIAELRKTRI